LADEGAFFPITRAVLSSIGGGGGVAHDCHDFGTERFANGFANGAGAFGSLGACLVSGKERAFEGMPAFRRAILVVSLENIVNSIQGVLRLEIKKMQEQENSLHLRAMSSL